jgi:hypothetical protein
MSLTDASGALEAPVTLRRKAEPGVILGGETCVSRARVSEQGSSVPRTRNNTARSVFMSLLKTGLL